MEPNYFGQWKQSIVKQLRDTKKDKFIRRLDDDSLVINYLTYIRECVLHSVTVHESKDILKQLPTLSPNEAANYQRIKSNLISGSGISPYLSTNASKLRPDDLFLALGIMHLHMGQITPGKSFSSRTSHTIHAKLSGDNIYFIAIGAHGQGNYTNSNELKIIYENWPEQLNVLKGVTPDKGLSSEGLFKLRQQNIMSLSSFTDEDGNVISVITESGYSTAKTSTFDLETLDCVIRPEITELTKKSLDQSIHSEPFIKNFFSYDIASHRFKYYAQNKDMENPEIVFEFSSLDFWGSVFSKSNVNLAITIYGPKNSERSEAHN